DGGEVVIEVKFGRDRQVEDEAAMREINPRPRLEDRSDVRTPRIDHRSDDWPGKYREWRSIARQRPPRERPGIQPCVQGEPKPASEELTAGCGRAGTVTLIYPALLLDPCKLSRFP